jgi:tetratricopeptide (TPR) repeat protein
MSSAGSSHWRELLTKKQQVDGLLSRQVRVVANALAIDERTAAAAVRALSDAAAAATAAATDGSPAKAAAAAAAAAAALPASLTEESKAALADSATAERLIADAAGLLEEMPYWEDAAALQAWLLLRAGRLDEAGKACAPPAAGSEAAQAAQGNSSLPGYCEWRWWLRCQAKWQSGDLSAAQELLQEGLLKLDTQKHNSSSSSSTGTRGAASFAALLLPQRQEVQALLEQLAQQQELKAEGNKQMGTKQYEAAIEAYGKALALQPSAGFAAVLHSNRAAAFQSMGRFAEALADCGRSAALCPSYGKAYTRWVARHDVIRVALTGSVHAMVCLLSTGLEDILVMCHAQSLLWLMLPCHVVFSAAASSVCSTCWCCLQDGTSAQSLLWLMLPCHIVVCMAASSVCVTCLQNGTMRSLLHLMLRCHIVLCAAAISVYLYCVFLYCLQDGASVGGCAPP